jgi:hypothetical protein
MDENAALHQNGIEICQKVNGGISFHLTAQENDVRHRTMSRCGVPIFQITFLFRSLVVRVIFLSGPHFSDTLFFSGPQFSDTQSSSFSNDTLMNCGIRTPHGISAAII